MLKLKPVIEGRTNYRIKAIKVTAYGKIERVDDYFALEMINSPHKIFLTRATLSKEIPNKKSGLLVSAKKTYDKTMNFFKGVIDKSRSGDLNRDVRLHCKHNAKVKFVGLVHAQADGSFWLSKPNARIVEIEDDGDLIVEEMKDI